MLFYGAAHAAEFVASRKARRAAKEAGKGPLGQALAVTRAHMAVGVASAPVDVVGAVLSPFTAIGQGTVTYTVAKYRESRKVAEARHAAA